ncbi:EAL domain-containing protein [Arcobacter arenosus]|uniref:EAL domain-containing protein n=1 Tax=Arcobacter arenosus TaxID=2576037 RepID=UPI003BA8E328
MFDEETRAYQEQISSLNQIIVELQQELFKQKQDCQIMENDLLAEGINIKKDYSIYFEQSPNILIIVDKFGKIKNLNESAINFFEKAKFNILEQNLRTYLDQSVFMEYTSKFQSFLKDINQKTMNFHFLLLKNQKSFSLNLKKLDESNYEKDNLIMGVIVPYDSEGSQSSNYLSHLVLDQLKDGVIITNEQAKILKVNSAFTEITGYSQDFVLGKTPSLLKSGRHTKEFYSDIWTAIKHHGWWAGEIWNKRKNNNIFPEWLQINRVVEPVTKKMFYIAIFSDITDRKKRQYELDRLAHYDLLTGLVNRHFLNINFSNLLEKSKRKNTKNAILFMDLDHFKQVNDIYGHHEGDLLLQETAQRILSKVRTNDIVARVGGDEFVIILSRIQNEKIVLDIANSLIKEIRKPFFINKNEHNIGTSIGVSIYPDHGTTTAELMSRADSAMYRSKNAGRNQVSIFKEEDEKYIIEKDNFKNILLKTLKNPSKYLEIFYQPIFNIANNQINSLEALLRIKNEKEEFVNPENIISIAESEGLIVELGELIFNEVCSFYKFNKDNNLKNVPIAVNLSVLQLMKESFIESFESIAFKRSLQLKDFNFEITETSTMENLESLNFQLNQLSKKGSKIYLDDFGTGYASLSQLHNLPIDIVKVDKSFTFRIDKDEQARKMVNSMISMTHGLNCKIVIEGVETNESLKWLKSVNANYLQGYLFSKPLNKDEIRNKYLIV